MKVLALMAHPDDVESICAGTLILLKWAGWSIHLATMTAGDLGSKTLPREEIAAVRRREAAAAALIIGAPYTCLGFEDLMIAAGEASIRRVTALVREVRPDLILTHSPVDYMSDHEQTARIAREAAFASTVPNWSASLTGANGHPCDRLPTILYGDAVENVDHFGRRLPAGLVVDITEVIDLKERMLSAHRSQHSWLLQQHGNSDYLQSMRRRGADRARDFGRKSVRYAEGFNQHLGPPFPKLDLLTEVLGKKRVKTLRRLESART